MAHPRHVHGSPGWLSSRPGGWQLDWLLLHPRWDPVTFVLLGHACALLLLGQVLHPAAATMTALGFGVWRVGLGRTRDAAGGRDRWTLVREGGSLLLAAALVAADGGTESPFFFWIVILVAWQAMVYPLPVFTRLVTVGFAAYVAVVIGVPDLTTASVARLGLLTAFCAVVGVGRLRIDHHQRAAALADALMRDAFTAAPVGLAVITAGSYRISYANAAATELGITELLHGNEDDGPTLRALVDDAWESHQTVGPELLNVHRNGREARHLRILATSHRPDSNTVVVCGEDVTTQVTVGEERRRFLLLASHQLRTPLTPIIAYAELLKDTELDRKEVTRVADEILAAGLRLERLFDRMATVTRLQRESPRDTDPVPIAAIIAELERLDATVLDSVEIAGDRLLEARCRPEWVARALRELLDNGHRFGQPPIRLSWTRHADAIEFSVTDSGAGPPDLTDDVLFGDWGKGPGDETVPPGMGTRLGLLQARLLAELSGGELGLQRAGPEWAFTLRLSKRSNGHATGEPQSRPPRSQVDVHEDMPAAVKARDAEWSGSSHAPTPSPS